MDKPILTKDSLIPLGLVLTLMGAAVTSGAMYQRLNDVEKRLTRMEDKIDKIAERSLASQQP